MIACNAAAWFRDRQSFRTVTLCNLISGGIFLAIWGPVLLQTIHLPAIDWMEVPDMRDFIHAYLNLWGVNETVALLLYVFLACLGNVREAQEFLRSRTAWVCLWILLVSSLLPFLVSQYKPVFDDSRTPSLFFPLAAILVSLFITRFKNLWLTFGFLTVLFGIAVIRPIFDQDPEAERSARSSVKYVMENAKCGDVIIAGGVSVNETSYYLRRLHAPDCIAYSVFPKSMTEHPGWMDARGLIEAQAAELASEARVLVGGLSHDLETQNHLWYFYDSESEIQSRPVLDILKAELDDEMVLTDTIRAYGTFFDLILVYAPRK
jgi:hypothetical protein